MSVNDAPEIYNSECGCGRPLGIPNYHRPCNLVFCSFCIGRHECKPVNGPISSSERPGRPVLLPATPDDVVRGVKTVHRNGTSKTPVERRKGKR